MPRAVLRHIGIAFAAEWPGDMIGRDHIDFAGRQTAPHLLAFGLRANWRVEFQESALPDCVLIVEDEIVDAGFDADLGAPLTVMPRDSVAGGDRAVDDMAAHTGIGGKFKNLCVGYEFGDRRAPGSMNFHAFLSRRRGAGDDCGDQLLILVMKGDRTPSSAASRNISYISPVVKRGKRTG